MNALPGFTAQASLGQPTSIDYNGGGSQNWGGHRGAEVLAQSDRCGPCWLRCLPICRQHPYSSMCAQCRGTCAHICRWYL